MNYLFNSMMTLHTNGIKTIQLNGKTVQIKPAFENADQAISEGVYIYKLFDFMMDFTFLPKGSRPEGYISPDEMADKDNPYYYGRLLFDTGNSWIYDGNQLTIDEQEALAEGILNN
jgi:hypothetical protein